jgi:hypothetical protein
MSGRNSIYTCVLGAIIGLTFGCGGSNSPGPTDGGTQVAASFAQNVQPIFNARCTSCHSGTNATGDLDLSAGVSYANLVNRAASSSCAAAVPGAVRVRPADTAGSMLWRKLANTADKCGRAMPFGSTGLITVARSEFDIIEKWIQDGALNN